MHRTLNRRNRPSGLVMLDLCHQQGPRQRTHVAAAIHSLSRHVAVDVQLEALSTLAVSRHRDL